MEVTCERLPYAATSAFSKLVTDYLNDANELRPFYTYRPQWEGIEAAIAARKQFQTNRPVLVAALQQQYANLTLTELQKVHVEALLSPHTFTVTTAHQPNIFTGPLYFIYKILHAIKLAATLAKRFPDYRFVPVYYMGSEDADLDELGHFFIDGEKLQWDTTQTGAVGRMHTTGLDTLVNRLEGQFAHLPFGKQMVDMCRKAYTAHSNVQEATLYLVHELFKEMGLLVVIPDNADLKKLYNPVVKRELAEGFSQPLVHQTIAQMAPHYKVQTEGRPINLFYLDENGQRERIERINDMYKVASLNLSFSEKEILDLVDARPELFSANVILRPGFQETILPNIAFIGGGGEMAYWMELKKVFEACGIPYPVLVLRNSFLLLPPRAHQWRTKSKLSASDLFLPAIQLLNRKAAAKFGNDFSLSAAEKELFACYRALQEMAGSVESTLLPHVAAMHTAAIKQVRNLEKKLQRAARKKLDEDGAAIIKLKNYLFPNDGLQERVENFLPFFAQYGPNMIQMLLDQSLDLDPAFTILSWAETR